MAAKKLKEELKREIKDANEGSEWRMGGRKGKKWQKWKSGYEKLGLKEKAVKIKMRKVLEVQNKLKHRKINFEKKVEIRMCYREKSKSKKE